MWSDDYVDISNLLLHNFIQQNPNSGSAQV